MEYEQVLEEQVVPPAVRMVVLSPIEEENGETGAYVEPVVGLLVKTVRTWWRRDHNADELYRAQRYTSRDFKASGWTVSHQRYRSIHPLVVGEFGV
jgi:hypothetical protein